MLAEGLFGIRNKEALENSHDCISERAPVRRVERSLFSEMGWCALANLSCDQVLCSILTTVHKLQKLYSLTAWERVLAMSLSPECQQRSNGKNVDKKIG